MSAVVESYAAAPFTRPVLEPRGIWVSLSVEHEYIWYIVTVFSRYLSNDCGAPYRTSDCDRNIEMKNVFVKFGRAEASANDAEEEPLPEVTVRSQKSAQFSGWSPCLLFSFSLRRESTFPGVPAAV
ncbi:hypothetical protein RRG08_010401 [Elysia crispata]|uniref:Uncharacterized protein n=1 Tax=Elysia crispata TaxID=231223 RepID=A0AAE1BB97_9GAST|nr:hypothetical protein RRG08_010401 [Elysia crispata]